MLAPKNKGATPRARGKKVLVVQGATGGACEPSPRMLRGCCRTREYQRNADANGGYTSSANSSNSGVASTQWPQASSIRAYLKPDRDDLICGTRTPDGNLHANP